MQKILIIGATSAIAEATAKRYATQEANFYLLARNQARLEALASDLKIRGATAVDYKIFDANDYVSHAAILEQAIKQLGNIDIVLIAHGTLSDQKKCEKSFDLTLQELNTNAISVISLLTYLANYMEEQGKGTIAVIGSVAGDRGRQSNYIYGTAKGAISIFLQGLRNRLAKSKVNVLTIKPGFVDTPMTASFKKGLLWAKPEDIAKGIELAIKKQKNIVYLPNWWMGIMLVICAIPERIFKKLTL